MNIRRQSAGIKLYFCLASAALVATLVSLTLSLWVAALHILGNGWSYLGQGYPLYPRLKVSQASLLLDAALQAAPIAIVAAVLAAVLPRSGWLTPLLGALFIVGYGIGLDGIAYLFSIDFGTTWAPGEAARALMTDPLWTPLTVLCGLGIMLILWRWCRP